MPINGFTTVDLGCERGNNAYYPVQKTESFENANYFLKLFEQIWNDKDKLQDVTDVDLVNVNIISIAAIFVIILIIFKSISLPVILVAVIEFAIMINMAIPYYQGISLPFVASIVIGAIQLGATVDYAILMTTRYQKERSLGKDKMEAISIAHKTSMPSIISSGLSFFAATFGVACYSQVEMIGSICTLLARGAIISMVVVLLVLPAMFMIFDKLICKTSIGFLGKKAKAQTSEAK